MGRTIGWMNRRSGTYCQNALLGKKQEDPCANRGAACKICPRKEVCQSEHRGATDAMVPPSR